MPAFANLRNLWNRLPFKKKARPIVLLSRDNQPPSEFYVEPVVQIQTAEQGGGFRVVDKVTGQPITFGRVIAATWQFGIRKTPGEADRTILILTLDSPEVIQP